MRDAAEVWLTARQRRCRVEYSRVFVAEYDDGGFGVVVQERAYGLVPYTFYRERRIDRLRRGVLLYRRR